MVACFCTVHLLIVIIYLSFINICSRYLKHCSWTWSSFPNSSFHPLFPLPLRMGSVRLRLQTWQSAASWSATDSWPWKMNYRRPYWIGIRLSPISFQNSLNIHTVCHIKCVFLCLSIYVKDMVTEHQTDLSLIDVLWLYLLRGKKNQPVFLTLWVHSRRELKINWYQRIFLDGWRCQLENEMVKVNSGLLEGPRCGCQSPRAEIKVGRQGQRRGG